MSRLEGKTCLVTGGTSGIGKEIAIGLASLGARVHIVGRNESKCKQTVEEIGQKVSSAAVSSFLADLSSQAEIRRLADSVKQNITSLDVLVNNAGVFLANRSLTIDGIESTFAVNHLAPFVLTTLLSDLLKSAKGARVVTTSSIAHRGAHIDFNDIGFERRRYSSLSAYGQSKLANILFTRELARKLAPFHVTANCFHPGAVRTGLLEGNPTLYRTIWTVASPFFLNPAQGADTAIYLASSPEVEGVSGKYFVKRKETKPSAAALDDDAARRLWRLSEEMTHIVIPD